MRYVLLLGLLTLAGCAPTLTGANERGGMISHVGGWNRDDAFKLADGHCKQFGRTARVSQLDALESIMTFDCVQ